MTRGFFYLKQTSAILSTILTMSTLIPCSVEISMKSSGEGGQTTSNEMREMGLLYRMLMRKSLRKDDSAFSRSRHFYFKPRRKSAGGFSDFNGRLKPSTPTSYKFLQASASNNQVSSTFPSVNKEFSVRTSRRKRSFYNYTALFGPTAFSSESQNMEDLKKSHTGFMRLYHRPTSSLLQITPDGTIAGVGDFNKYCLMVVKSVDHVENMTMLKIYGNATKLFLAMDKTGVLYTTVNGDHDDTKFLHEYDRNSYDAYLSYNYRRYIAMVGSQGNSSPVRGKRFQKAPNRALFLGLEVDQSVLDSLTKAEAPTSPPPAKRISKADQTDHGVVSTIAPSFIEPTSQKSNSITSKAPETKSHCNEKRRGTKGKRKGRRCRGKRGKRRRRKNGKRSHKDKAKRRRKKARRRRTQSVSKSEINNDLSQPQKALRTTNLNQKQRKTLPQNDNKVT